MLSICILHGNDVCDVVPHPIDIQPDVSLFADQDVQSGCEAAVDTPEVVVELVEEGGGDANAVDMGVDSKGGDMDYFW